ncbi:MAG: ribosomal protein S18-alanine N-acetyltransferase [Acidobacteriales bacterium]|nr:ribosomal protein S18-alanine N-acetyltransferase [Terriglobales bacterium]
MNIRRATIDDLTAMIGMAAVADTSARWSAGHFAQIFGETGREAFVAVTPEDAVVGFVVARAITVEWEIENVVVSRAHRRQGIGKALVTTAVERARLAGAVRIHLEVRASNSAAIRLYAAAGFQETGRRMEYYSDPNEDALLLTLPLT